jgi:RcsF protein
MKKNISTKLIYLFSLLLFSFLLSACASRYEVTTNLDNDNFRNYFSPAKVIIYENESDMLARLTKTAESTKKGYHYIGAVEGEDCQEKSHHLAPDETNARTNARRVAFDQGANAIIFTGCVLIDNNEADKKCVATTVCYGKAFHISTSNNE